MHGEKIDRRGDLNFDRYIIADRQIHNYGLNLSFSLYYLLPSSHYVITWTNNYF